MFLFAVFLKLQPVQPYGASGQWPNNAQYTNGLPPGQASSIYPQQSQGIYKKPTEQRPQCKYIIVSVKVLSTY
jgi:hypothetical protein